VELTLFVEHQCNLRCTYCYNGEKFGRRMPSDVLRRAIDLGLALAPPRLDLGVFGGEPLLHFDLLLEAAEYLDHALARHPGPPPRVHWVVNTNGTRFTDAILDWLAPPRPATVFVSLDGPAAVHDRHRRTIAGQGSHAVVRDGIAAVQARGIAVQPVAVVSVDTARALGATVSELLGIGAPRITLSPNLRDDWTDDAVAALRAGLADAGARWSEAFRAGRAVALEPLHTKILTHLHGGIPCPARCQLGGSELCVTPTGRIYPCAQMVSEDDDDRLVIGHVDRGLDPARIAALQQQKDRVEQTCAPCALRDRCMSHCGCRHVALAGALGEITATLCELESAFIDAADAVAEALFAEGCPTFVDFYYRKPRTPALGSVLTPLRRARDA
jgi:uncharacterized protein